MGIKKTQEEYLQEVKEILTLTNDLEKYDLSQIRYLNAQTKVDLRCIKHNYTWGISPGHIRNGRRCPKCKSDKLHDSFASTTEEFIKKSEEIYGKGRYGYDNVDYINNNTKVEIKCNKHGYFLTSPDHWLPRKNGCPKCSTEKYVAWNKKPIPQIIAEAGEIHHNRNYDYSSLDETKGVKDKQEVICSKHGSFIVTMEAHISSKSGCPKCGGKVSLAEEEINAFIKELGFVTETNIPLLGKSHIDIFIPSLKIGIEYCGLYFHGELMKEDNQYHIKKFRKAIENDINLIQIFEDEWIHQKDIIKNTLRVKLGKSERKFHARKLEVKDINMNLSNEFFKATHIQGGTGSITNAYSLVDTSGSIYSVMAFTTSNVNKGEIELCRFSSIGNIMGGFSKLLNKAKMDLRGRGITTIISYSDNRWGTGKVYERNGFTNDGITPPRYWWCKDQYRFHRRGFQRKYLPEKLKVFVEEMSEAENCRANGFYKIWDAGITRWNLKI